MYIIYQGSVRILREGGFIRMLSAGQIFGERSAIARRIIERTYTAIAAEFCTLYILNRADIDAANSKFPDMHKTISNRLNRAQWQLATQSVRGGKLASAVRTLRSMSVDATDSTATPNVGTQPVPLAKIEQHSSGKASSSSQGKQMEPSDSAKRALKMWKMPAPKPIFAGAGHDTNTLMLNTLRGDADSGRPLKTPPRTPPGESASPACHHTTRRNMRSVDLKPLPTAAAAPLLGLVPGVEQGPARSLASWVAPGNAFPRISRFDLVEESATTGPGTSVSTKQVETELQGLHAKVDKLAEGMRAMETNLELRQTKIIEMLSELISRNSRATTNYK
mmetsp:Transcript_47417/g.102985  ORF Transcript_47417/g.102985 Transcript_47417/m.102985 type:complete len:335 (-) Transcript_47417:63-1067(-)